MYNYLFIYYCAITLSPYRTYKPETDGEKKCRWKRYNVLIKFETSSKRICGGLRDRSESLRNTTIA